MIKVVTWFKRRADLSPEAFVRHWQGPHAEKVVRMPGLRHYTQNPTHPSAYAGGREPFIDGFAETWFDDTAALRANAASDAYAAVRADEFEFLDVEGMEAVFCTEQVVLDGPRAPLKFAAFIRRRPGLDVAVFQQYWRTTHGPIAARNPYMRRYVQNHVRPSAYTSGNAPSYDGVPMTWFDSFDDLRASAVTEELAATRADEVNFMDDPGGDLPFVIATEHVVIP